MRSSRVDESLAEGFEALTLVRILIEGKVEESGISRYEVTNVTIALVFHPKLLYYSRV